MTCSYSDEDVDRTVMSTLQALKDDFFISLQQGASALNTFLVSWDCFDQTLRSCRDRLQSNTLDVVFSFASAVAMITSNMLDLQNTSENICQRFSDDVTKILDEGLGKLTIVEGPPHVHTSEGTSLPLYIESSCKWLLNNLGNPYPSKELRCAMAQKANCSLRDIDGWFIDARRRLGWNTLRKKRFCNKRTDIVEAATRFFIKSDPSRPLDPTIELEFASIESRAKDLYSTRFTESALASKLDTAVKDMTPEMKAQAKAEVKRRKREIYKKKIAHDALSYPSPERSPGASPEPSLPSSPMGGDNITVTVACSARKRRNTSGEVEDEDQLKPRKRTRLEARTPVHDTPTISLPSPAASLREDLEEPNTLPSPLVAPPPSAIPTAKRKRRLSDADGQQPKRPNIAHCLPRLQAASDPFPMPIPTASFDEWYQTTFITGRDLPSDIPPAVSVEAPDATAPLDIEIYNFSSFNAQNAPCLDVDLSPSSLIVPPVSIERNDAFNDENAFLWFDVGDYSSSDRFHNEVAASASSLILPELIPIKFDHSHTEKTTLDPSLSLSSWSDSDFPLPSPLPSPFTPDRLDLAFTINTPQLCEPSPQSQND